MTSQLNVDTIVDKAGTGGTNVKIANNAVAVAEGGSATTNVVQGLCNAWAETNSAGTSIAGSFNIASLVDTGTGIQTCNYTNGFSNANYPVVTTGGDVGDDMTFSASTTGTWQVYAFNGAAYADVAQHTIAIGDLA